MKKEVYGYVNSRAVYSESEYQHILIPPYEKSLQIEFSVCEFFSIFEKKKSKLFEEKKWKLFRKKNRNFLKSRKKMETF